jgi:hypothetical protein
MNLEFDSIYNNINKIVKGSTIDLSEVKFIHPWGLIMICLLLIERSESESRQLILPNDLSALTYLKRMHFNNILNELNYINEAKKLEEIEVNEKENLNIQEILHCHYGDEFNTTLGRFIKMFQNFGLSEQDARLATGVVGELGNNVFDHNSFSWPTQIVGSFIAAQSYPASKCIEVAVGDPGVGFKGSLITAFPELKTDKEAIMKGLAGNSGRVGEVRGNGLRLIQQWTINNFTGEVMIHSGDGLVVVK